MSFEVGEPAGTVRDELDDGFDQTSTGTHAVGRWGTADACTVPSSGARGALQVAFRSDRPSLRCNGTGAIDEGQGMEQLRHDQVPHIGADPDLLELFYREHNQTVKRFVARRVQDPHRAADLTADIFLAAMETAHRYRPESGSPAAWLVGIARNTLADEVRRRARHLRAHSRIEGHRLLDEDSTTRIAQIIDAERLTRLLYESIAELPARDRALLELVAVDGLTITDAATVLGIKPGTARVRLHRSRQRAQQLFSALAMRRGIQPETLSALIQEATS